MPRRAKSKAIKSQKTKSSTPASKRKGGAYKTTKHHRDVVEAYDKKNTQSIRLKLNKKYDKDILAKLNKSNNKQGTIKNALRGKSTQNKSK